MTETNGEREAIARLLPNVPHLSRGARYINLNVARLLCTRTWSFSLSSRLQASSSCSPLFSISLSWRGVRSLPIYLPTCLALHLGYLHTPYLLLIYFIHTHTLSLSISLALWFPFTFFSFFPRHGGAAMGGMAVGLGVRSRAVLPRLRSQTCEQWPGRPGCRVLLVSSCWPECRRTELHLPLTTRLQVSQQWTHSSQPAGH